MKKCKNFLVTLIKLASSGTQSPDMATNVKALVRALLVSSRFVYVLLLSARETSDMTHMSEANVIVLLRYLN